MNRDADQTGERVPLLAATQSDGGLVLTISGSLDSRTIGQAWQPALEALRRAQPRQLTIDASRLTYCDGAGAALLLELGRRQSAHRGQYEIRSLDPAFRALVDLYSRSSGELPQPKAAQGSFLEQVGRFGVLLWNDVTKLIAFVGELSAALARAALRPRIVRWEEAWLTAELA